jgi:hypothetical protein
MDKYNTNRSLLSRVFPKNPQNTTGYHEKITTSQNKSEISRIKANFGRNCQNILNFAARVSLDTAQKISITTAVDRSLLDIQGGRDDA